MSLAICITTFNRKRLVEANARSLQKAKLTKATKIIVLDDASSEFDVAWLKAIYPQSASIFRREATTGDASLAAFDAMSRLVATGADVLLLLDSDFIVNPNFLKPALQQLTKSEGLLSLFNTPTHPTLREEGSLLIKPSVGAAATLWTRECALDVLKNVARGKYWDWRFSSYFENNSKNIYCVKTSLAQHLGLFEGQHLMTGGGDIGIGFDASGSFDEYLLFLEQAVLGQQSALQRLENRIHQIENRFINRNLFGLKRLLSKKLKNCRIFFSATK